MKCVRGIKTKELSWHELKRLFRKKYLLADTKKVSLRSITH